jgi:hypothetical protein
MAQRENQLDEIEETEPAEDEDKTKTSDEPKIRHLLPENENDDGIFELFTNAK